MDLPSADQLVATERDVTHLDLIWDLPPFQSILSLGESFRVIVFDTRGTGLSDRSLGFASLEDRTEDIRAPGPASNSIAGEQGAPSFATAVAPGSNIIATSAATTVT